MGKSVSAARTHRTFPQFSLLVNQVLIVVDFEEGPVGLLEQNYPSGASWVTLVLQTVELKLQS